MSQGYPSFQVSVPLEEAGCKLILGSLLGLAPSDGSRHLSLDSDGSHLRLGIRPSGNDVC